MVRTIVIPDVDVLRADWSDKLADRLANPDQLGALWASVERMHGAAKDGGDLADVEVEINYEIVRGILCRNPVGALAPWPLDFWQGSLGRTIFYCFVVTHGERLMFPKQVAAILGVGTPRLGHIQSAGALDFIVDADADHPRREVRRVTPRMLQDYLEHRATPRALARYRAQGREGEIM